MSRGSPRTSGPVPGEFLQTLSDRCEGFIELRALPSRAHTFVRPGDLESVDNFALSHGHENVYLGIATRRDASRGDLLHCLHLPALFVDIDFKAVPKDNAHAAVKRFALRPSIAVRTGGGVHLYWLLREPMDLTAEAARAKDLLRRLAIDLGGDLGSAEPARILRLPGSSNHKYMPPRPVVLTHLDSSLRYNPNDFDSLLPAAEPYRDSRQPGFAVPETIAEGTRNSTLYKLGRSLKARGLSEPEILATLIIVNAQRCQPSSLGDDEVRALAHQAATQHDQPGFVHWTRRRRHFTVEVWP